MFYSADPSFGAYDVYAQHGSADSALSALDKKRYAYVMHGTKIAPIHEKAIEAKYGPIGDSLFKREHALFLHNGMLIGNPTDLLNYIGK